MRQAVVLRLEPTPRQREALLTTMEAFNRACQYVADMAYERRIANKIALQPVVYGELRSRFGLSSQMAVRSLSKACEAYKQDKRVHVRIDLHSSMIFDQRIMSFKGLTDVSLLCLSGRQLVPFRFEGYEPARPDRVKGQADLLLQNGVFTLHVCVDLPSPPPPGPVRVPGAETVGRGVMESGSEVSSPIEGQKRESGS